MSFRLCIRAGDIDMDLAFMVLEGPSAHLGYTVSFIIEHVNLSHVSEYPSPDSSEGSCGSSENMYESKL